MDSAAEPHGGKAIPFPPNLVAFSAGPGVLTSRLHDRSEFMSVPARRCAGDELD